MIELRLVRLAQDADPYFDEGATRFCLVVPKSLSVRIEFFPGPDHCGEGRRDHPRVVVAEVIEANVAVPPTGRPDAAILEMKDLGDNVFYGG